MAIAVLHSVLFEDPPSSFIALMPLITLLSFSYLCGSEILGKHLQYSKFWNVNSNKSIIISSRTGMLVLYTPALLASLASFAVFKEGGVRLLMVKLALTIHFLKRDFEVLFVHKYTGGMVLDSAVIISILYFIAAVGMVYIQHLTKSFPEPIHDMKYVGALLYLVGLSGNFYHHYLLSKLRKKDEKGYKIPTGGLFNVVICPHYLFEIVAFLGVSFMSQTSFSFSVTVGSALYLIGRSYATRKWYLSKFDNFPKNIKALIPYVF